MINARTKYMAQLVAEAFNVQEYEASVSHTSIFSFPFYSSAHSYTLAGFLFDARPFKIQITATNLYSFSNFSQMFNRRPCWRPGSKVQAHPTSSSTTRSLTASTMQASLSKFPAHVKISSSLTVGLL